MRQIVLDTETTGLDPALGHRIIEIGCIELIDRRVTQNNFHHYINPGREIDQAALAVHGITQQFLDDKPNFADVAPAFCEYIKDAEVIIHNAPFDMSFIDHEFCLIDAAHPLMEEYCTVFDSLVLARKLHPGQRNSLDALCKRYEVDNSHRNLHGALLDARLLASVYLLMTGGQTQLFSERTYEEKSNHIKNMRVKKINKQISSPVIFANEEEIKAHWDRLAAIEKISEKGCLWQQLESSDNSELPIKK